MGVIHKLHPDVINYIRSSKKSDPSLSCRQLAEAVESRLGVKISKSSVSNILKAASLNDSVGRKGSRSKSPRRSKNSSESVKDNFAIPSVKKRQILKNLQEIKDLVSSPAPDRIVKAKDVSSVSASVEIQPKADGQPPPLPGRPAFEDAPSFSKKNVLIKGVMSSGMGLIFLKAAQWSTTFKSMWPRVFEKSGDPESDSWAGYWDNRCFLKALGADDSLTSDVQRRSFWALNGDVPHFVEDEQDRINRTPVLLNYEVEARMASSRVSSVQILLENGRSFWVDPRMISIHEDSGGCRAFGLPLAQTIGMISRRWMSHCLPLIFFTTPEKGWSEDVSRFHDMCEGAEGCKTSSAVLYDGAQREMFASPAFPNQKRIYLMGLWPWRAGSSFWMMNNDAQLSQGKDQFSRLFQKRHAEEVQACYCSVLGTDMILKDFDVIVTDHTSGFSRKQRSILVVNGAQVVWGVLTNDFKSLPEHLIGRYLGRWPNGDHFLFGHLNQIYVNGYERCKENNKAERALSNVSGLEPGAVFDHFLQILRHTAATLLFPAEAKIFDAKGDLKNIFETPGITDISGNNLQVVLKAPEDEALRVVLTRAAAAVNEADIVDGNGRNVNVYIK